MWEFQCDNCGSVIEFTASHVTVQKDADGDISGYWSTCINCHEKVNVDVHIPPQAKRENKFGQMVHYDSDE